MTETKKISGAEKLAKIQAELKAPKDLFNKFGNYHYRSAESILEAVKPLLDGAILTMCDDIVLVGDRYYIKATATFTDGDFTLSTTAFAREPNDKKGMDDSQITGTASSYARKYALNALFCIDDAKDADTDEYHEQTKETKPAVKKTVAEYIALIDNCEDEQAINRLFYEWSKVYLKGTPEYNSLSNKSFERKKQIVGA
jgi:hypothetical protein